MNWTRQHDPRVWATLDYYARAELTADGYCARVYKKGDAVALDEYCEGGDTVLAALTAVVFSFDAEAMIPAAERNKL